MKLTDLKKHLKNDELNKAYLFFGNEAYLKLKYADEIRKKADNGIMTEFNILSLEGSDYRIKDIDDAIEQLPVMSDRKLIILKDTRIFSASRKAKAEYKDYWTERLKDIPEAVCILFVESEIDKRSALYKYMDKNYTVTEFEYLDERDMKNWVGKLLIDRGKKMEDIDGFLSSCDLGMEMVISEIDKLTCYTGDRNVITKEDVALMVTKPLQNQVWEVVDGIIGGKSDFVIKGLNEMFALKEEPVRILSALSGNFEKMLKIKQLQEAGIPFLQLGDYLGEKRTFLIRKYAEKSAEFSTERLRKIMSLCAECDMKLKSSTVSSEMELQFLIFSILK